MYVNIETLEPVSHGDITLLHPETSFPPEIDHETLAPLGFAALEYDPKPNDIAVPGDIRLEGGRYIQSWVTELVIPTVVTMAQAKLALLYAGLLEAAEQYINGLPEPQKTAALIEWNHRQTLERGHPLVGQVADGIGLTEQQLDDLFLDASTR